MGQSQTPMQIVALFMLFAAGKVLTSHLPHSTSVTYCIISVAVSTAILMNMSGKDSETAHLDHEHRNFGMILVGGASLLSGLSAALTQKAITATGKRQRHVFLLSIEMAVYGILFLLGNLYFNSDVEQGSTLISHWTLLTWIPVITNVSVFDFDSV